MSIPTGTGGKVLDASALMAWTTGSLALASWIAVAPGLGLTLLIPSAAPAEALIARPGDAALLDVLLTEPAALIVEAPESAYLAEIEALHGRTGVFDPLAVWVVALCRARGWPALSTDPARLERVDPAIEVTRL